jgi:hypothetical protein
MNRGTAARFIGQYNRRLGNHYQALLRLIHLLPFRNTISRSKLLFEVLHQGLFGAG